jgi:putative FmdB family regulatory protein
MPIYDYSCPTCGRFTAMRPMAQFREPCACPTCDAAAPRTLLGAPALAGMNPAGRSQPPFNESIPEAAHPAGCGCCVRRSPIPKALAAAGRVFASNGPQPGGGR